jgi:hypothetical protein
VSRPKLSDPKLPAAKRRLNALLRDDEYGPLLARLNRADERRVLDLIYDNKGREARKLLVNLDTARRRHRRLRGKVNDYNAGPKTKQRWRQVAEDVRGDEAEFWKLYAKAKR